MLSSCSSVPTSQSSNLSYDALIEKGRSKAVDGQLEEAYNTFLQALALDSNRVEAYYGLGFTYSQNCWTTGQECETAIDFFDRVIARDSLYRRVYYNRALCLAGLEDFEAAIADLDRQISLDASDPDYFGNRAAYKLILGDTIGGCADYQELIAIDPQRAVSNIQEICP